MNRVFIVGHGAVSPAGWGVPPLRDALRKNEAIPTKDLERPGLDRPLLVRPVPSPAARPFFLSHARLRRASTLTHYAVAAALEALGDDAEKVANGSLRLGIILCVMSGCVNYSRRFYSEVLREPGTASPILFPETVFNAPVSHLAALLGTPAIHYTLVGDPGMFLSGLAVATGWLAEERVDGCLVIGAEEIDWVTADAYRLFDRKTFLSEGCGALYLQGNRAGKPAVELHSITQAYSYSKRQNCFQAARFVRAALPAEQDGHLLCDSTNESPKLDAAELTAWQNWRGPRLSPKTVLGEGLSAASAWQCVLAIDALQHRLFKGVNVSVAGCNQQAIGAYFGLV
jgi:3-oxoacyl-(acyl-carrier-protein) synthase